MQSPLRFSNFACQSFCCYSIIPLGLRCFFLTDTTKPNNSTEEAMGLNRYKMLSNTLSEQKKYAFNFF